MAWYDAALERWPGAYRGLDVPTRFGSTFVVACGDDASPPLILLHGAGSNSAMWRGEVSEYSRHYRVLAVDLLGEPGKSAPVRPDWKGPAYADWLADVMDAVAAPRASFVGLSQGAWTALKLATSQPQRVERLVLLSPGGVVPDRLSFAIRALTLSLLGDRGTHRLNRLILGPQSMPPEVGEGMRLVQRHFRFRLGLLPQFSDEQLKRLTMPVLLLVGEADALRDGQKIATRLRSCVPQLVADIVPGAGHALVGVSGRVLEFLTGAGD